MSTATVLPRTFRTLVAGQALGQLGDGLTEISFAQLVVFDIGRGATPATIAGVFAVTLLPFSLVGPLAGVLIDRSDRRRTLMCASACRAALAPMALAAVVRHSALLACVGVVLLLSSSRFALDAKSAVLPRTVPLPGLIATVAVAAVTFQALKIVTDALVGGQAPDAVRGRVFAIYDVGYNVAFVVAGLALVPLWQLGRERALLWWLGAAFVAGWLLTAHLVRTWPFARRRRADGAVPYRWGMRAVAMPAGAVVVVVFPEPALWWAAWFTLVPWLLVVRHAPTAREAAMRGFFAAAGFLLAVHYWLLPSTVVFLPVAAALLGALWVPWSALTWRLLRDGRTARGLLVAVAVVPAAWVLIEPARSWSALGGPWGLLGTSQWRSPAFLAPASLGGVWLVSFLIVACNVAVAVLVETRQWRCRTAAIAVVVGLLAAGPAWFAAQPRPSGSARIRAAVVEPGVVPAVGARLAEQVAATRRLTPGRYGLVVWGESSVGFDLPGDVGLQHRLEVLAAHLRGDLLVNVDARSGDGAVHKTAVLLDGHGVLGSYDKVRLVPFGEYIPMRPLLVADVGDQGRRRQPGPRPPTRRHARRRRAVRAADLLRIRLPGHEPRRRAQGRAPDRVPDLDDDLPGQLGDQHGRRVTRFRSRCAIDE